MSQKQQKNCSNYCSANFPFWPSQHPCEKYDMCFIISSEILTQLLSSANSQHFTALNVAGPEYRFVSEEDIMVTVAFENFSQ